MHKKFVSFGYQGATGNLLILAELAFARPTGLKHPSHRSSWVDFNVIVYSYVANMFSDIFFRQENSSYAWLLRGTFLNLL